VSASTVANASFRMEPQYMITGQAAGVAAAMAARESKDVHEVSIKALQQILRTEGQILDLQ